MKRDFNTPFSDEQLRAFIENEFKALRASAPSSNASAVKVAKPKRGNGYFKPAKRVSRGKKVWAHLDLYPGYEISNYGEVRSVNRAAPGDRLKPEWRWTPKARTHLPYFVLYRDKQKCKRQAGPLMASVGFATGQPKWWNGGLDN